MKKSLSAILALVLCLSLVFTGCSKDAKTIETKDAQTLNETIVATVGDLKITQAEFNLLYMMVYQNMAQYSSYYGDEWETMEVEEGKTMLEMIKESTVEQVKQIAAIYKLAENKGIEVDKEIKENVLKTREELIKNNFGGDEGFKSFLEDAHSTDEGFRNYLQVSEIYSKTHKELTKVGGEARIPDEELEKQFLEENKDKWRVQHILISTQPQTDAEGNETEPARSEEEAKKLADEVIKKLDEGADFDKLIDEYDEDPGMASGNFYLFGAGEMVPEFEEASKNLEFGAYTKEAVKSDFGYHIIKRYEINTEIKEFNDFKDSKLQEKAVELIDKEMEKLDVKLEDKIIDPFLEKWAKERKEAQEKAKKEAEEAAAQAETEATETTEETAVTEDAEATEETAATE